MAPPYRPTNPLGITGPVSRVVPIRGTPSRNNMSLGQILTAPGRVAAKGLEATAPQSQPTDSSASLNSVPKLRSNVNLNQKIPSAGHGSQATAGTLPPHAKTAPVTPKTITAPPPGAPDKPVTPPGGGRPNNHLGSGNNGYYTNRNQLQLAKGQSVGFTAGRDYYAKNAPAVASSPVRRPASGSTSGSKPAGTAGTAGTAGLLSPQKQALQQVMQSLAPLYRQLNSQGAAQDSAITNFSRSLINDLQGLPGQVQNEYSNAIGQQQNLVDAATNSLRAANPDAQVQNDLQAIGAPQAQQQAVGNQINTAFNGNAALGQYTNGVLPLGSLRSQGLTAETLARLQPGFEGLRGQQALAGAQYQQGQERAKLSSQVPGLVQRYLVADQAYRQKQDYMNFLQQKFGVQVGQNQQRINQGNARLSFQIGKENVAIDQWNAKQKALANKIDPKISAGFKDGFAHNSEGQVIMSGGKPLRFDPTSATVSTKGKLTQSEISKIVQSAYYGHSGEKTVTLPNPDANGNPVARNVHVQVGQQDYGATYRQLRAAGVSDQNARAALNAVFARGERGRAWLTNREQGILGRNKAQTTPGFYQGHPYLTARQYQILSTRGAAPLGERGMVNGQPVWYIAPGQH